MNAGGDTFGEWRQANPNPQGSAVRCILLAAACVLWVSGCGGPTPTSPSDIPVSELSSAPTRIIADGKTLSISASLWRDFMPIAPPDGHPLGGVLKIATDDGSPVPAGVTADTSWVIHNADVWSTTVEQRSRAETAPIYELVVRNGPKWGPHVAVDVVVRLRDKSGRVFLLRAAGQHIGATW
jgi:hypothetical protein